MTDTTPALDALAEVDRSARVGRTVQQVTVPSALVIVGAWLARLNGVDLNPLDGETEIPADVVAAFVVLLTWLGARRMNRRPPAVPAPAHDVVEAAAAIPETAVGAGGGGGARRRRPLERGASDLAIVLAALIVAVALVVVFGSPR